jgi:UDP-N-acetylmuramoyl-tripeptide--D-alanyl-D-alanine ligase
MKHILWTSQDIQKALNLCSLPLFESTNVCIDTRKLEKGDLYIALQGENTDGHHYVEEAFKKGASACVVKKEFQSSSGPLVAVEDTLKALENLGIFARNRSQAKIIGITGSAGKTSTKEIVTLVLSHFGKTSASLGGLNNHWGLPLSLARLHPEAEFGVFEMGMNHLHEIEHLTKMARPDVAIITNVEKAHLGNFNNFQEIAEAKSEIFLGVPSKGLAILNQDNQWFDFLKNKALKQDLNIITFGEDQNADVILKDIKLFHEKSHITVSVGGQDITYTMSAPGLHMAKNSLIALSLCFYLKLDLIEASKTLAKFKPLQGRGLQQMIPWKNGLIHLIDEAYNANFASIEAALGLLSRAPLQNKGRRIAILGDMRELGEESQKIHDGLKEIILKSHVDLCLTCGPHMGKMLLSLPQEIQGGAAKNVYELLPLAEAEIKPGDVVLIKGSRGWTLEVLINHLKSSQAA